MLDYSCIFGNTCSSFLCSHIYSKLMFTRFYVSWNFSILSLWLDVIKLFTLFCIILICILYSLLFDQSIDQSIYWFLEFLNFQMVCYLNITLLSFVMHFSCHSENSACVISLKTLKFCFLMAKHVTYLGDCAMLVSQECTFCNNVTFWCINMNVSSV